ncbi:hypothetical protein CPB83DRAFT_857358 [Crepidotus variabilis]|uniref:Uncharacterized protein n=1 Tax=Crepidotus variabilis TaxID=179855 RepID=A0A9P6ECX2_9AGAR|nr:hypothetical protein CPB83DRAFT_857358 [Crepidotus variabilis]
MSCITQLPMELYQKVIWELRNAPDTLKAISITCRSLSSTSQQTLFAAITIRSPFRCCSQYQYSFGGSPEAFLDLLNTSPHIANYIRALELFEYPTYPKCGCSVHPSWWPSIDRSWIKEDSNLQHCLPLLRNLQAFVLTYSQPNRLPNEESLDEALSMPVVTSIQQLLRLPSLVHFDVDSFPVFSLLQNAGPNLKHVFMSKTSRKEASLLQASSTGHDDHMPVIHLESLSIGYWSDIEDVRNALSEPKCNLSLCKLKRLYCILYEKLEYQIHLSKILDACVESLEELMVHLASPDTSITESIPGFAKYNEHLDLSAFKSLRRLRVSLQYGQKYKQNQIPWFLKFLSSLSGLNGALEEITIDFDLEYSPQAEAHLDLWNPLPSVLLSGRYPKLRMLKMKILTETALYGTLALFEESDFVRRLREMRGFVVELQVQSTFPRISLSSYLTSDPSWLSTFTKQRLNDLQVKSDESEEWDSDYSD